MVANAIHNVLSSDPNLMPCINDTMISTDTVSVNLSGVITSCGIVKVKIATTLAFASGLMMVC